MSSLFVVDSLHMGGLSAETLDETTIHSQELFRGEFLHAFQDQVLLPDGHLATREYVVHPGAVMIVPLIESIAGQYQVVLERQYRYPLGRVMIEFPAGKLNAGESCFACAQRELLEETGYKAMEWAHAGMLHPAIAYSNEFIDIWFARRLMAGSSQLDQGEFLEVIHASPTDLLTWCVRGDVTDAKTLTGALWLQNVVAGLWTLDWQSVSP